MSTSKPARRRVALAPRRGAYVPIACALLTILVVAVANLTWITSPYWGRNNAAPPKPPVVGSVPVVSGAKVTTLSPNRIVIPKLKAVAPIIPVATTPDGELDVPQNPRVVGWWSPGAKPGAHVGTAILAGHINYAGVDGTLSDIGALKPGDTVYVYGKRIATRAVIRFTVTGVRTYHKTRLPYRQIFDQKSVGRIAIVTCGGPFDASTGNYLDNIVVFAVPAAAKTA